MKDVGHDLNFVLLYHYFPLSLLQAGQYSVMIWSFTAIHRFATGVLTRSCKHKMEL